jgi:signal transduction histidine kinase
VPVELNVAVEQRLPEQVETAAYYVVSEALTNAAKHAAASLVQVRADIVEAEGADLLRVEVRDDGRGGAMAQGTGLLGLKDRAEALGGRIFLDSPPGSGTTLRLELPLSTVGLGKFR